MDANHFDQAVRMLTTPSSRRRTVHGLVGGVLAMVLIALSRIHAGGNETVEARYESRAMNHEWG